MKKKPGDIIILHKCTKNHDLMLYHSWDMAYDRCNCYFSFWAIFWPFTVQKIKITKKMKKTPGDIILHMWTKKYDQMMYGSWDMVRNRWTDGWKKWHTEVDAPPKNCGPTLQNSLGHADNRKYFLGLSLLQNQREAHVLLGEGSGKIWTCSCWEKGNFIMIKEFRHGQAWKIWSSPLSLSL